MIERSEHAKGLVRLLQFVLRGPARLEGEGSELALVLADGTRRRFPRPLLAACARHGLLVLGPEGCTARPEARSALKRLLAGPEQAFMSQHGAIGTEERLVGERRESLLVNRSSSVLMQVQRLKDRDGTPWFPQEAIAAGERLAADFQFAGLQPRLTASWEPKLDAGPKGGRGAQAELSDSVADARARVSRAARALGPELAGVALDVCCFSKGLELVERERHWPARSAKLMLRTALLALARHYGLLRLQ